MSRRRRKPAWNSREAYLRRKRGRQAMKEGVRLLGELQDQGHSPLCAMDLSSRIQMKMPTKGRCRCMESIECGWKPPEGWTLPETP